MRAADPLDTSFPVALDDRAPAFEDLTEEWSDRATARQCLAAVHRMDIERAAQPPVVNVTVPGIPGHFTGQPGGPVSYVSDQAPTAQLSDSLA